MQYASRKYKIVSRVGLSHCSCKCRDLELAACPEFFPRGFDICRTGIETKIVDRRQYFQNVPGAAADVENPITNLRPDITVNIQLASSPAAHNPHEESVHIRDAEYS